MADNPLNRTFNWLKQAHLALASIHVIMLPMAMFHCIAGTFRLLKIYLSLKIRANHARRTFLQLSTSKPPHISQFFLLRPNGAGVLLIWKNNL
jgi:hypothetical protein